jgi:K+/H+ antiporter YhaU regulatory subunit KhtT
VFGAAAIDWLTVATGALDLSVGDLLPVDHPSATLVAIVRGESTIMKPGPDELVRTDDQLLVAGNRADIGDVRAKVGARS